MKRVFILGVVGVSAACASGAALAHVDVGVYLGAPAPVYVAPPVVYEAPPVAYVPAPAYGYEYYDDDHDRHGHHDHGWHRGWEHHHHGDDDD